MLPVTQRNLRLCLLQAKSLLHIFQDCLVKNLLLVLNWNCLTSQLHLIPSLNICKERIFLVISMFFSCYRMAVEKYPDNRMLGCREVVNGKVYSPANILLSCQ